MEVAAMPEWIISLIPQLGIVVLFMWYQERAEVRRNEVDKENHLEWRTFITDLQQRNNETLTTITNEVKENTKAITNLSGAFASHDTRSAGAVDDLRRLRERITRAGILDVEDSPLPERKKTKE